MAKKNCCNVCNAGPFISERGLIVHKQIIGCDGGGGRKGNKKSNGKRAFNPASEFEAALFGSLKKFPSGVNLTDLAKDMQQSGLHKRKPISAVTGYISGSAFKFRDLEKLGRGIYRLRDNADSMSLPATLQQQGRTRRSDTADTATVDTVQALSVEALVADNAYLRERKSTLRTTIQGLLKENDKTGSYDDSNYEAVSIHHARLQGQVDSLTTALRALISE